MEEYRTTMLQAHGRELRLSRGRREFDIRVAEQVIRGLSEVHLPFPREYDSWTKSQQLNYENGRLTARNILAAGLALPRVNVTAQGYAKYRDYREAAIQVVGPATPSRIA